MISENGLTARALQGNMDAWSEAVIEAFRDVDEPLTVTEEGPQARTLELCDSRFSVITAAAYLKESYGIDNWRTPKASGNFFATWLGGAAGNACDRLLQGFVTDMLEPLFVNFAVFNVADACLVIGCLLVLPEIFDIGKGDEVCRPQGGSKSET